MPLVAKVSVVLFVGLAAGLAAYVGVRPAAMTPSPAQDVRAPVAAQGLRFEPNVGQSDPRVDFVSRGPGYTLLTTRDGALVKLAGRPREHGRPGPGSVVGLRFVGASPHVTPAAAGLCGEQPTRP